MPIGSGLRAGFEWLCCVFLPLVTTCRGVWGTKRRKSRRFWRTQEVTEKTAKIAEDLEQMNQEMKNVDK